MYTIPQSKDPDSRNSEFETPVLCLDSKCLEYMSSFSVMLNDGYYGSMHRCGHPETCKKDCCKKEFHFYVFPRDCQTSL